MSNRQDALLGCSCSGKCLDVGCGKDITPDNADGIDIRDLGQKFVADIERPWPIDDNTYDHIHAWNIVEHIRDKVFVLNEMWRVLKPGGIAEIVTPDFSQKPELAIADPTHVSFWVKGTIVQYFCGTRGANIDIKKWELIDCQNYKEVNDNLIIAHIRKPI
jgi:ubiquinone/menaquinone biosynthesis C-methylase UbiE